MPRAYWNGFLKLSLVSCAVALYPASTAAERVSFRQVNRRTGHRLKHQLVDSVTGEAVDTSRGPQPFRASHCDAGVGEGLPLRTVMQKCVRAEVMSRFGYLRE